MIKYILACMLGIGTSYYAATAYVPGLENEGGARDDTFRIGAESGGASGYTAPSSSITSLTIDFVQSGTAPAGVISSPFAVATFPSTLKKLYLTGNATGFNTLVNGVAGNALPKPPAGCEVHFSLTTGPAADPVYWFQSDLESDNIVYVDPLSADPYLGGVLANLVSTNTLYLGTNIALPAAVTELNCLVKRNAAITQANTATKARLTAAANLTFKSAVSGISIGGAYSFGFDENSLIIDPQSNVTGVSNNGTSKTSGTILYVAYISTAQGNLPQTPGGTSTVGAVSQIIPVTKVSYPYY